MFLSNMPLAISQTLCLLLLFNMNLAVSHLR